MSDGNCSFSADPRANGTLLPAAAAPGDAAAEAAAAAAAADSDELDAYYAAMERLTRFVCYQALGTPVSALGVLGNVVSVAVLTRRSMLWGLASTNCYLVALACSDVLYLLMLNFGVLGSMWQRVNGDFELEDWRPAAAAADGVENGSYPFAGDPGGAAAASAGPWKPHPFVLAAVNVLSNTSVWIVVAFTTERYIAVSYPMRGRVLCNPRRAKWAIAAVCTVVLLLHVPNFFELDADGGGETAMARHPAYRFGYNWGVLVFLFAVLPMTLLAVFNCLLIRSVARAAAARRNMTLGCSDSSSVASGGGGGRLLSSAAAASSSSPGGGARCLSVTAQQIASVTAAATEQQQRSVTIMLVAVVMIFFLLHAPNAVMVVATSYEDYTLEMAGRELSNASWSRRIVANTAINFLTLLSSSVNFLLYSALSKKFRQTLRNLARPCKRKRRHAPGTASPHGGVQSTAITYGMTECERAHGANGATKCKVQARPLLREDSFPAPGRYKAADDDASPSVSPSASG